MELAASITDRAGRNVQLSGGFHAVEYLVTDGMGRVVFEDLVPDSYRVLLRGGTEKGILTARARVGPGETVQVVLGPP